MDLDSVAVRIRPRSGWESVDLGIRVARANAWAIWGAFLPVYAIIVAIILLLFQDSPGWACFAIWWFKPWYDRVALHVLSRAVFGATPRISETLRALPQMFRKGAFASVLHMRFDASRSLNLPSWQLEQLGWSQWRKRVRIIESAARTTTIMLAITCLYLEATAIVSLIALAYWLVPPELLNSLLQWWWTVTDHESLNFAIALSAWIMAIAIVEPFYVAGGFGLYLNRRTELEAWDIEIAFRRMADRHLNDKQAAQ